MLFALCHGNDDIKRVLPTVLAFAKDPVAAKAKAIEARAFVQKRQRATIVVLTRSLPA